MVGVAAKSDSKAVFILGYGLNVSREIKVADGIFLSSNIPKLDYSATVEGCRHFFDYAAAVHGSRIATFVLRIEKDDDTQSLLAKAWNALWIFHLLSVATQTPCISLYSVSDDEEPLFSATSPSPFVRPGPIHDVTEAEITWVHRYAANFNELIKVPEFSAGIRCFASAQLLPEQEVRIMLLWAGIEGLLSVDAELSRRIALYSAILLDGTTDEKAAYLEEVKKAYAVRSRAVHGSKLKKPILEEGCSRAASILTRLLGKCVELGRVPSAAELDRLAVAATVQ